MASLRGWALAAAVAIGAGAMTAAAVASEPAGDPAGAELAQQVDASYAGARGVRAGGRFSIPGVGSVPVTTVTRLRAGAVAGMHVRFGTDRVNASILLLRQGTFTRMPRQSCWRRSGGSEIAGVRAISAPGATYEAPRPGERGTELTQILPDGSRAEYLIAPGTARVLRSSSELPDGTRIVLGPSRALSVAPRLPRPVPRCAPAPTRTGPEKR